MSVPRLTPPLDQGAHVVVIGAGAVGACSAAYLQRQGLRVTIVDRLPPGEATSFGNAGSLSPSSVVPIAVPGMLKKVPGWLLRSDGPLTIRLSYLPTILPWLVRYVRAGTAAQVEASAQALAMLHGPGLESHEDLAAAAGAPELVRRTDYLHVFGSDASFRGSLGDWTLRRRHGAVVDLLDAGGVHEVEPDLSPHYVRGALVRDQGFTLDPSRLVKAYVSMVVRDGGAFVQEEVRAIETDAGRAVAVRTADGRIEADAVVVAGGAWSRALIEPLGVHVPLDTERGYHATIPSPGIALTHTIMEADFKFMATPMAMGVRFAGMVELAGLEAEPDPRRAAIIQRLARRMFPKLQLDDASEWMGFRPSLPDGLPVIGPVPDYPNVLLAFGHAHTGMIGSPMTGRIVAGLASGRMPNVDIRAFRPDRF
ncbi:MAG: FAD-dependent oxidoreductase [Ectothiorhodospiraceae bacterium]|nr:FAD-dependent oxidoreductase [Chromatiales bacterium]MCP5155521.1 FAD-dependent oxidoreductase [Ectothiorhodospiraceae bacterium]